jgi:murein L,D-transpeptidase YcbB/YkuD
MRFTAVAATLGWLFVLIPLAEDAAGQVQPTSAQPTAPSEVEVSVVVKARTSNALITATIYSAGNCATYNLSCKDSGRHFASQSPSKIRCPDGYKIYARTDDKRYYIQSTPADCYRGAKVELLFAEYSDTKWLADAGNALLAQGQANIAVGVFSMRHQLQPSQEALEDTLNAAAIALKVDPQKALYFDRQQGEKGKNVASHDLAQAIIKFQREKGLVDDGILGPETLQKLAGDKPIPIVIQGLALQPAPSSGRSS